jgi:hypothetical protein
MISLNINQLIFVMVMYYVFCEVGTEIFNIIQTNLVLQRANYYMLFTELLK